MVKTEIQRPEGTEHWATKHKTIIFAIASKYEGADDEQIPTKRPKK